MSSRIRKFLKIQNVGKFKLLQTVSNEVSFSDDTVIHGYNTYGKSTLTAILRSLKDQNKNLVFGRRSFGSTDGPAVEILFEDGTKKFFSQDDWFLENLEIFDNVFISKNVFDGQQIEMGQKSNLYNILLDGEVRTLKETIDYKQEEKKKLESEIRKIKQSCLNGSIKFESYINLVPDEDAEIKIEQKKSEITQLQNIEKIKRLLSKTNLRQDFDPLVSLMQKRLDISIETLIDEHIKENWARGNNSRNFLKEGVQLLKSDGKCVFCGQELQDDAKTLVDTYKKVFNEEYVSFQNDVNSTVKSFKAIDLEKELSLLENCGINLIKDLQIDLRGFIDAKQRVDKKIEEKQTNLNLAIELEQKSDYQLISSVLTSVRTFLANYEKSLSSDSKDLRTLQTELKELETKKVRFTKEQKELCESYKVNQEKWSNLKKEIEIASEDLGGKVNTLFETNKKNINELLKFLGADFQLKKFEPSANMNFKNPYFCDYIFEFFNITEVPISNKRSLSETEPEELPHFNNTFSDSDRRLLAFAFFVSKLKNDTKLDEKIIILDDPFSSFDEKRKDLIVRVLNNLENDNGKQPLQKIILTHSREFLCQCYAGLNAPNRSRVFLKIANSLASGSYIDPCDVKSDFLKEQFFQDLEYIKDSIENNRNLNESLKKVRPCFEHLLKRKYYFPLYNEDIEKKSIDTYLDKIGDKCSIKKEILDEHWHVEMHDNHPIMQLEEPAKVLKLQRALELFEQI